MNMLIHLLQPLCDVLAASLVNGVLLSAFLYFSLWALHRLRPGWSAATRHRIGLIFLTVFFLAPVFSWLRPRVPAWSPPIASAQPLLVAFAQPMLPESSGGTNLAAPPREPLPAPLTLLAANWTVILSATWATAAILLLLRLGGSVRELWLLHRSALTSSNGRRLEGYRRPFLLETADIASPVAIGIWPPKILVPLGFTRSLSEHEAGQVFRHELAHIQRRDDWSNLLVEVLKALCPLNPFLWLVASQLRLDCEMACDDSVLVNGANSHQYAGLLARLASAPAGEPILSTGVGQAGQHLLRRVERILDANCDRSVRASLLARLEAVGVIILICGGVFAFVPAFLLPVGSYAQTAPPVAFPTCASSPSPDAAGACPDEQQKLVAVLKNSALTDKDQSVREEAARSLTSLDKAPALDALVELLQQSDNQATKEIVVRHLNRKQVSSPGILGQLAQIAQSGQPDRLRILAIEKLSTATDAGDRR